MPQFNATPNLDALDIKILALLQENSGLTNIELAERIGLSASPSLRRVKSLEERGLIAGYRAIVERNSVGLGVRAFVEVRLERQHDQATEKFLERVKRVPEIVSCYLMTGGLDFLLEIMATDLDSYGKFATSTLTSLPGVKEIRSSFVLKEISNGRGLPLGHLKAGTSN